MTPLSLSGRVPVQNQCSAQTKLHIKFAAFCPPMAGHHQLFSRQWSAMANEPDIADIISFLSKLEVLPRPMGASAPALASTGDQEVEVSRLYHCPSWADQVRELPAIGERICQ